MADLLKVMTPVINKNQPVQPNMPTDAPGILNIQNTEKVIQTHNQTNLSQEHNNGLENSSAPAMLLSLLKDPAVAASYLKNISFLEEIFKLLPANNRSMTAEIEQLFGGMMMNEQEIAPEMMRQGETATLLRGELFDFLRQINEKAAPRSDLQAAIANFLRAANGLLCRQDIQGAVYNNLLYLKKSLHSSKDLSAKLDRLLAQLAEETPQAGQQSASALNEAMQQAKQMASGQAAQMAGGAQTAHTDEELSALKQALEKPVETSEGKQTMKNVEDFPALKREILSFLSDVESSILYNSKMDKVLSILKYNLSRYTASEDYFHESAFFLRQHLSGPQRRMFSGLIDGFLAGLREGRFHPELKDGTSRVMDTLTKLLGIQAASERLSAGDEAKVEQILHSLLSSPCNFTPLLHFIIPVDHLGSRAFAEIWVNPDSDEKDMPKGAGKGVHFLLVIDSEGVGRFEADVYVHDKDRVVDFQLFCPPGLESTFSQMSKPLAQMFTAMDYRAGSMRFDALERPRSLMEAFKSLPYKRMGLDVKV